MCLQYGIDDIGERISPTRSGQRARCELCGGPLIGKCGRIVRWHWAHVSGQGCEPWAERLTAWHVGWQMYLIDQKRAKIEVPVERDGEKHRADAVLPVGTIIEIQHSSISPQDIERREDFYGETMVWVFDVRAAYKNKRFELRRKTERDFYTFR